MITDGAIILAMYKVERRVVVSQACKDEEKPRNRETKKLSENSGKLQSSVRGALIKRQ